MCYPPRLAPSLPSRRRRAAPRRAVPPPPPLVGADIILVHYDKLSISINRALQEGAKGGFTSAAQEILQRMLSLDTHAVLEDYH